MGTDIHTRAVDKDSNDITDKGDWAEFYGEPNDYPWADRSYRLFGWLANMRNMSEVTPIAPNREWMDAPDWLWGEMYEDNHSHSWVALSELNAVDYSQIIEDQREGKRMTLMDFLGSDFFHDLEVLNEIGADRVYFCFDS